MQQTNAIQQLSKWDLAGRYVFQHRDLRKLFPDDNERAFNAGLTRLVSAGILYRPARGVYVYALSHHFNSSGTLQLIAKTLRSGEYNYVSLESALSAYGLISQIPVDRLTIMTTGRKGVYKTRFGTIEFTHTKRSVSEILESIEKTDQPLRIANQKAALRDLRRVGRNMHLVTAEADNED
jgi:predicted transcriptional regulator of viral defense system